MFFNYNKRKTQRNEGKNSSKTRWQEARKKAKKKWKSCWQKAISSLMISKEINSCLIVKRAYTFNIVYVYIEAISKVQLRSLSL